MQTPRCSTLRLPAHAASKRLKQLQDKVTPQVPHELRLQDERAAAEDAAREARRAQRWAATRAELQAQHAQVRLHVPHAYQPRHHHEKGRRRLLIASGDLRFCQGRLQPAQQQNSAPLQPLIACPCGETDLHDGAERGMRA